MTKVVSVCVSDIRPKYADLYEWMQDETNVYIARKGIVFIERNGIKFRYPPNDSIWANPYKISDTTSREDVIDLYRQHLTKCIKSGKITVDQLLSLDGKTLGCWCKKNGADIPCHGDVIVEMINKYK